MQLTPAQLEEARKLKDDFKYYAKRNLKIRSKNGQIVPLILNEAQEYAHSVIEGQRSKTGRVRVLILKGRQQGMSTYTEGRFYHKTTWRKGVQAFILTHEQQATDNLFSMVSRYHENSHTQPSTARASTKELYFDKLDSGYKVGTAGTKGVGRSSTIQYFHGSEVAFWPNADEHVTGIFQAIPDAPDTEVILESTANGIGNLFHKMWQRAESGQSEFKAIFIPWYWQSEYCKEVPDGFKLDQEEEAYKSAYNLTDCQMVWRRSKIYDDFHGDLSLFRQEYPATSTEAFMVSGEDSFISPDLVVGARKSKIEEDYGAKILGVDPARFGNDLMAFCFRQGRKVHWFKTFSKKDTMEAVGLIAKEIRENQFDAVFIDIGGLGVGIYDRLIELGHRKVYPVNFGSKATDDETYLNKRAEIWGEVKNWLKSLPVSVPDDDELHSDLISPRYSYDSMQRIKLEKKEEMRKRGVRSPDKGDALALTFSEPVAPPPPKDKYKKTFKVYDGQKRTWMSV